MNKRRTGTRVARRSLQGCRSSEDRPTLWKDADPDPDVPIQKEAKAEYANVQYADYSPEVAFWEVFAGARWHSRHLTQRRFWVASEALKDSR